MSWTSYPAARLALAGAAALATSLAVNGVAAQEYGPVAQRAIDGAKAYVKPRTICKNPQAAPCCENSLFRNADPDFLAEWKELTGDRDRREPLGYTDIPSKIMGEAVAKTGAFDIFNDFPYTQPDAASAGVLLPLDDYAAKDKPDFSGIPDGFRRPAAIRRQAHTAWSSTAITSCWSCARTSSRTRRRAPNSRRRPARISAVRRPLADWEEQAKFFHTKAGETRWGIKFEKPLYGAMGYRSVNFSHRHFPILFRRPAVRQGHESPHQHPARHQGDQGVCLDRPVHARGHPGLGHAADLSVLGSRPGLFGHVLPLDLRLRQLQSRQASSRASRSLA